MKKFFMLLCLLLVNGLNAQPLQVINSGTSVGFWNSSFLDNANGVAVLGNGNYLKTTDGGNAWTQCISNSSSVLYVSFLNALTGFSCGLDGTIGKTTNGGTNWMYSTYGSATLRGICFLNELTGFMVGSASTVLMTSNGGINWNYQVIPISDAMLTDIDFVNGKGYISAWDQRNLFTTTNNGLNWIDAKAGLGIIVNYRIALNSQTACLVGKEGSLPYFRPAICYTTNGGANWKETIGSSHGYLIGTAISPNNPKVAIAVGKYYDDPSNRFRGYISRTTNGGETWSEEAWGEINDTVEFRSVNATNTDFLIFGSKGLILRTSHIVGVSQISSEVPQDFKLAQNFPNPFNPTTTIIFDLPKAASVSLIVSDLSGRIIARLVENEKLSPGTYSKSFNAANLSSGIYFYRLQTETMNDTKRMMLIK